MDDQFDELFQHILDLDCTYVLKKQEYTPENQDTPEVSYGVYGRYFSKDRLFVELIDISDYLESVLQDETTISSATTAHDLGKAIHDYRKGKNRILMSGLSTTRPDNFPDVVIPEIGTVHIYSSLNLEEREDFYNGLLGKPKRTNTEE